MPHLDSTFPRNPPVHVAVVEALYNLPHLDGVIRRGDGFG